MLTRRTLLGSISGAVAGATLAGTARIAAAEDAAPATASPAPASPATAAKIAFSYDLLTERMRDAATRPYAEPTMELPDVIAKLTYDQYKQIAFRPERALWGDTKSLFRLETFQMGWLFKTPVRLFEIDDGAATPIIFTGEDFDYRPPLNPLDFKDLKMSGVAGFRLHFPLNRPDVFDEVMVFQGASYFRALGRNSVYGLSSRGIAIDTATEKAEEFPIFTEFYIERPTPDASELTVFAAMEGPSITGAFQFRIVPGEDTITDVTARFFFRADIKQIGIAPMNSMFLFGESNHYVFDDYRLQVHDSDGLEIVEKSGRQFWRALNNPVALANSFFGEQSPHSFSLLQRQRDYAAYEDAEARYERRPSLRVEPAGDWGQGNIQLVEIPTDLEQNDNIVAYWTPAQPAKAGGSLEMAYRLLWGDLHRADAALGLAVATRTGVGGPSGIKNEAGLRKFVVDFAGGLLGDLPADTKVEAKTNVAGGEIVGSTVFKVEASNSWRLAFDVRPAGAAPMELSSYLQFGDRVLTETWQYQWRKGDEQHRA
jgi:glucans biosynthesis protein